MLAPQDIDSEGKLVVNFIRHIHSVEPGFLIVNDLRELCIVEQKLLNLDPKLSLRAHIQLVTTDNSWTCPICQPFLIGMYVQL